MKNKESNFISAVLYVHNAEGKAGDFIEQLNAVLNDNFLKYEIICVNDWSNDNSGAEIREAAKSCTGGAITVIDMGFYHGLENSMNAGVDYASGDFVFEFDSLYSDYNFNLIIDVYKHCLHGYDIVGASPNANARVGSRLFYSLFNKYSKTRYPLKSESFRILSRRAINRIKQVNVALPYRKVVYANCGLKMDDLSYTPKQVNEARRSDELSYRSSVAIDSFIIFTSLAGKLSLGLTFVMLAFSILTGVYTIAVFVGNRPVEGWTTTMLVISFGFFGMFAVLSLVIKYLSVILNLIFKKIKYVIGNIEKLR